MRLQRLTRARYQGYLVPSRLPGDRHQLQRRLHRLYYPIAVLPPQRLRAPCHVFFWADDAGLPGRAYADYGLWGDGYHFKLNRGHAYTQRHKSLRMGAGQAGYQPALLLTPCIVQFNRVGIDPRDPFVADVQFGFDPVLTRAGG